MNRTGFTIWEILGVIVILLIIAAILFPVFAKSRTPHSHFSCASNEKQIGLAIAQYEEDNDGYLPNIAAASDKKITWRVLIFPYTRTKVIFGCPDHDITPAGPDGYPRSYSANYTGNYSGGKHDRGDGAFAGPGSVGIQIADIPHPDALITLCEVARHSGPDYNIDNLAVFNPNNPFLWAGHSGGSNYAFADGHVHWQKPLETRSQWHRNIAIPLSPQAIAMLTKAQQRAGH